MRKVVSLAFILAALPLSQTALADAPSDSFSSFGTPISASVIVSFPDSSATFKPDAAQTTHLADAKGAALVTIRGRTSTNRPSAQDESLALARAISARTYLIAHGVSPLKITLTYASAADFIADNSTPAGRLQNQRVEIDIVHVPAF